MGDGGPASIFTLKSYRYSASARAPRPPPCLRASVVNLSAGQADHFTTRSTRPFMLSLMYRVPSAAR